MNKPILSLPSGQGTLSLDPNCGTGLPGIVSQAGYKIYFYEKEDWDAFADAVIAEQARRKMENLSAPDVLPSEQQSDPDELPDCQVVYDTVSGNDVILETEAERADRWVDEQRDE